MNFCVVSKQKWRHLRQGASTALLTVINPRSLKNKPLLESFLVWSGKDILNFYDVQSETSVRSQSLVSVLQRCEGIGKTYARTFVIKAVDKDLEIP
ncbi:hypothetical protein HDV63DRAFT_389987 [Trichoderma sp. SZMC 28014]